MFLVFYFLAEFILFYMKALYAVVTYIYIYIIYFIVRIIFKS